MFGESKVKIELFYKIAHAYPLNVAIFIIGSFVESNVDICSSLLSLRTDILLLLSHITTTLSSEATDCIALSTYIVLKSPNKHSILLVLIKTIELPRRFKNPCDLIMLTVLSFLVAKISPLDEYIHFSYPSCI